MDGSLASIINLYVFTTGRGTFAIRGVRRLAQQQGFTELVSHCDVTLALYDAARALEHRWAGEPEDTGAKPEAKRLDVLVDTTLGALRDGAVAQTMGAADDDPVHQQVASFLHEVFPAGVHTITRLPYVEESARVDDIVASLKGPLAPAVAELGLGRLANRLADLAAQYREALEAQPPSIVGFDRIRAARAECQGMLLATVALVLGKHHQPSAEGAAARLSLLSPILEQNEAIGAYLRSRRRVEDVNPDTGEDEPSKPGDEQGPGPAKQAKQGSAPDTSGAAAKPAHESPAAADAAVG